MSHIKPPSCTACGSAIPATARFCPGCGRPVDDETGTTVSAELPPDETGEVPISYTVAEPRYFGVPPAVVAGAIAVVALALAVVLFVTGHWPFALILLGIAVLCFAVFLEVARRKPDHAAARVSAAAVSHARERAAAALESLAARSRAGTETLRLRRRLGLLQAYRRDLLTAFGEAVYRGDEAAAEQLRAELGGADAQARDLEQELAAVVAATRERIESAQLAVQQTQMIELPEPYPPPDEGTPPQPAPVPEPYPGPEIVPPTPDPVPTPGPEPTRPTPTPPPEN
jgi:hypothetical protein